MKINILLFVVLFVLLICVFTSCMGKSDIEMNAKIPIMGKETEVPEKNSISTNQKTTQKPSDVNNEQSMIKIEQAKKIALDDVKLSEDDVTFHEVEFEEDDGISYYDIKFVANGQEYEYEINAKSGKIIEWDVESMYD